jgi:plasmid stabilization system protein ParE
MVQINWTISAIADLKNIKEYIAFDSVYYAQKTISDIRSETQILKTFPALGRIIPEIDNEIFREIIFGNYRIMYKIVSKTRVDILIVFHSFRSFKKEFLNS